MAATGSTQQSGQPGKRALAAPKAIGLYAHLLKHADENIAQRRVVVRIERDVLPVVESTTREYDGEVGVVVDVGIPHVTAIEHHGVVQQTTIGLLDFLEIPKQVTEQFHLTDLDLFELGQLHFILAVMRKVVVTAE